MYLVQYEINLEGIEGIFKCDGERIHVWMVFVSRANQSARPVFKLDYESLINRLDPNRVLNPRLEDAIIASLEYRLELLTPALKKMAGFKAYAPRIVFQNTRENPLTIELSLWSNDALPTISQPYIKNYQSSSRHELECEIPINAAKGGYPCSRGHLKEALGKLNQVCAILKEVERQNLEQTA